jgi:hypothetical protein
MNTDALPPDELTVHGDAWPLIVGMFRPGPWEATAAATDLQWWRREHGLGKRMPSTRDLARRWGWTEARARQLVERGPAFAEPDWRGEGWHPGLALSRST